VSPDAEAVSREDWAVRLRSLPLHVQAGMLAAAVSLLEQEGAVSVAMESELFALVEQLNHSIAGAFEPSPPD
jgi:hypothetical protein